MDDGPGQERGQEDAPQRRGRPPDRDQGRDQDGSGGDGRGGKARRLLHNPLVLTAGAGVVIVLVVVGVLWWLHQRNFVGTSDAYVDTHIVHLAPQVAGYVERVDVKDNSAVRPGQLLVQIDPVPIRTQLDQARAGRAQALAQLAQARAEIGVDQARVQQMQADARAASAQAVKAARDLGRYQSLRRLNPRAVSQQQLDLVATQATGAAEQRQAARRQVKGALAQLAAARTQIGQAQAQLQGAEARIRQAGIDVDHTRIIAPLAGTVAQKTVAPGDYVQPGQQLMAIVPQLVWVTANFKETELRSLQPGQSATVSIDACKGVTLRARVDSIQRGAGQAFSLLPAENATGNFVKVVQRVPVKIVLLDVPTHCVIGPGMSVEPKVRIR